MFPEGRWAVMVVTMMMRVTMRTKEGTTSHIHGRLPKAMEAMGMMVEMVHRSHPVVSEVLID